MAIEIKCNLYFTHNWYVKLLKNVHTVLNVKREKFQIKILNEINFF